MKTVTTRCLGGLLIFLVAMGSALGAASADGGTNPNPEDKPAEPAAPVEPTTAADGGQGGEILTPEQRSDIYRIAKTAAEDVLRSAASNDAEAARTKYTAKARRESKKAEGESAAYQTAFDETFNNCMKHGGRDSREAQNECVDRAVAAGEAAGFTEIGGLPEEFGDGGDDGSGIAG